MLFSPSTFWYGFSQGFVIGPISLYGIQEGLNPKRGFWCQIQVTLGATLVDIVYLLTSTYGMAQFIQYNAVQMVLWSLASYMLITMGVNSLHERPKKMSITAMHEKKLRFYETDFVKAFLMNLVNPMAIVFATIVFNAMYSNYAAIMTPVAFAFHVTVGGLLSSLIVALLTLAVRHIFHQWMLKKLMKAGSMVLIAYGLWFLWKAAENVPDLTVSVIQLLNP